MMKRVSAKSRMTEGEATEKNKYQTLLMEYLELQKEFVSRKRKLQSAKEKKQKLSAEVRFLRRRLKSFSRSQPRNTAEALTISETEGFDVLEEETNQCNHQAADPKNCDHVLIIPSSCVRDGEGDAQQLHNKERVSCLVVDDKVNNNNNNRKKISWFDQVPSLKVVV